jgi:hypothetical protein
MLLNKLLNNGGEFEFRPGSQTDFDENSLPVI